jgi:hypothetical protein
MMRRIAIALASGAAAAVVCGLVVWIVRGALRPVASP